MAELSFETHGDRSSPAIVLVHALGTDRRFWDDVVADLKRDFFCITPDLQAAGATPIPATPVTAEQHAADVIALADSLGVKQFAIAGCALGGMVGAVIAAKVPDRVTALVMTNPGLRNLPEVKEMLKQRTVDVVEKGMEFLLPAATEKSFHNQPHDERYDRFVAGYRAVDPKAYSSSVLGFLEIDIEPYLPQIRCPVLLIPGGQDLLMPPEAAATIQQGLSNARVVRFEEAAHFIPYQAPDRLAAEMRGFLAG